MHSPILSHGTDPSVSSRSSRPSHSSRDSQSTTPTTVYGSQSRTHDGARHCHSAFDSDRPIREERYHSDRTYDAYGPTITSVDELFDEPEEYHDERDVFQYLVPEFQGDCFPFPPVETRPSTPNDFAQYFPSLRRLRIHHDETTYDGNMNLRVDTDVLEGSSRLTVQLFHLRMHDLQARQFSLRRYCRDSGREVCHSTRRYVKPASERPGIQRSMSNAFAALMNKAEHKRSSTSGSAMNSPLRQDSGYGSDDEDVDDEQDLEGSTLASEKDTPSPKPTNTIKLEFSNYAQVDVKRHGSKQSKRYEFEFWGANYSWRRTIHKDGAGTAISYHLVSDKNAEPVAHIVPELLSSVQMQDEELAGGWVPPCSMWISDPSVLTAMTDVADVIVSTGLMALVDDCIKRRFQNPPKPKFTRQFSLPLTERKLDIGFAGPKALGHVFRRRNSADKEKHGDVHEHKHSPLALNAPVEAY